LKIKKVNQDNRVISAYFDIKAGDVVKVYAMSDIHFDSVKCRRDLLKTDLDFAKKQGRMIIIAGDLFDAMQATGDRRASKEEIREEYNANNYLDLIVDDTYEFFKPYKDNLFLSGLGNHETAVMKYNNTNLVDRLCYMLRQNGSKVISGAYGGWIRFMFQRKGVPQGSFNYYYHHGTGGSAPVTRGVIHTNRQAVDLPDANLVHNGHNHQEYIVNVPRNRLNNKGIEYVDSQMHIRTPGYKSKSKTETHGYDIERHPDATPLGSISVDIEWIGEKPQARASMLSRSV